MNSVNRCAEICVKSKQNIEFRVCKITHILYEDETFKYIFEPNYDVISLTDYSFFQGIPGLNLDLKKKEYIRENINPCFISERVPPVNREDLYELLEAVGLDYLDPIEYLLRTKLQYSGDLLYLRPYEEKQCINLDSLSGKNNATGIMKIILSNLAKGNEIIINDVKIEHKSYKDVYQMISYMYEKSLDYRKVQQIDGIALAKDEHKYQGRKPISVNMEKYMEKYNQVEQKIISAKQAAQELDISIDKYYRIRKTLRKDVL